MRTAGLFSWALAIEECLTIGGSTSWLEGGEEGSACPMALWEGRPPM